MEQVVIALLMMINNEIKEARIQPSLSDCLKKVLVDLKYPEIYCSRAWQ